MSACQFHVFLIMRVFLNLGQFGCHSVGFCIVSYGCFESGCHYQRNRLLGKNRLRNDLLCVEWDIKHYSFIHSFIHSVSRVLRIGDKVGINGIVDGGCDATVGIRVQT